MNNRKELIDDEKLNNVTGGINEKTRYVSAFYCEYCEKTIRLNMLSSLERAKREHNLKFHPEMTVKR